MLDKGLAAIVQKLVVTIISQKQARENAETPPEKK